MNKIQIIVNNGAGTGSAVAVWKETKEYLQENKISYNAYLTRYEKHAVKLAGQICGKIPEGPIYLLVVGGDGTINEVLNGITDFERVRLGVIPTGSGNDFARNLGILRNTTHDNIPTIVEIESKYLSALESEAAALAMIGSEGDYQGGGEDD